MIQEFQENARKLYMHLKKRMQH